jgi:preprotein translocase subunit SecE
MESQHQKWVNISYLALAVLAAYALFSIAGRVAGSYDLETRIRHVDLILRGIAAVVGLLVFICLYRSDKANQFMNEVVVELSRVTWPSTKDTTSSTFIVMVMVVISGVILGFLDYCWVQLVKWVL